MIIKLTYTGPHPYWHGRLPGCATSVKLYRGEPQVVTSADAVRMANYTVAHPEDQFTAEVVPGEIGKDFAADKLAATVPGAAEHGGERVERTERPAIRGKRIKE